MMWVSYQMRRWLGHGTFLSSWAALMSISPFQSCSRPFAMWDTNSVKSNPKTQLTRGSCISASTRTSRRKWRCSRTIVCKEDFVVLLCFVALRYILLCLILIVKFDSLDEYYDDSWWLFLTKYDHMILIHDMSRCRSYKYDDIMKIML